MVFCLESNHIDISLGNPTDFVVREDIIAPSQQDSARFSKPRNIEYSITDKHNIASSNQTKIIKSNSNGVHTVVTFVSNTPYIMYNPKTLLRTYGKCMLFSSTNTILSISYPIVTIVFDID